MNLNNFTEIVPEDYNIYREYTKFFNNSEASVATMYMWQHYADVKYCAEDGILYSIYFNEKTNSYYSFMPYGKNRNSLKSVETLMELYRSLGSKLTIKLCTEDFVEFIKNTDYNTVITPVRNSFDYVYKTEDLINLSGKKYHSKKNHINSFNKTYKCSYIKYTDSVKDECINFCSKTLKQYYGENTEAYQTELFSIIKTFNNINKLNLKCGIISVDGNIIALSVGERLNNEYALIHIEKADYNYRTAYSVINNLFLINEFSDTLYVNREEDMGLEGLRKAKMSYHPSQLIKKYTIEFI